MRWTERALIACVLWASTALGSGFALHTPPWQAPDEPAHFNYAAQLAAGLGQPRIEEGDYPSERLLFLVSNKFPDGFDIRRIEYEDHQPPAYYYVASLPFRIGGPRTEDRVSLMRLSGVLLSLITITMAWAIVRAAWPADDFGLAIATAAGVAFLPMHAAIVAAINNDVLADIAMACVLLVAVYRVLGRASDKRFVLLGGAALGLALLTKLTVYPAAGILVLAEGLRWSGDDRDSPRRAIGIAVAVLAVGFAIAAPWFVRNMMVYGWSDPFGLDAHDRVVTGQLTTAASIAGNGVTTLLRRAVFFTFASFWGVFGWMGVFLDRRLYMILGAYSTLVTLGFVGYFRGAMASEGIRRRVLAIFGFLIVSSAAGFIWYNLSYVQHQGRYFFPALIPLTVFGMLGARWLVERASTAMRLPQAAQLLLGRAALFSIAAAMLSLSVLALTRYVIPGL